MHRLGRAFTTRFLFSHFESLNAQNKRAQTNRLIANAKKEYESQTQQNIFYSNHYITSIRSIYSNLFKSGFIRHTFGDYLVVILVYCFLRSFSKTKAIYLALITLVISFIIEFLQLTNFLEVLNLQDNTLAKTVLGSTFSISDLIAYTLGVITIYLIDTNSKR